MRLEAEVSKESLPPRRYCDQAATSWPKPPEVVAAWQAAAVELGVAPGRGSYREAVEGATLVERARRAWAELLGDVDPQRIAMPATATLGLNIALHGLLKSGDHVITTAADHNATLRPLAWLAERGVIEMTVVPCDSAGRVDPQAIAEGWRSSTRLVACSHGSNVTGVVQPAAEIAEVAHERGGLVVLDAAQTAGLVPVAADLIADVLVAPAHKWLLSPHGNACLWCREGVEPEPLLQGGTGSLSDTMAMPEAFAARHEVGTGDLAAAAGWGAAAAWAAAQRAENLEPHAVSRQLASACREQLEQIDGVRVLGADEGLPIVSFLVEHYAPAEVAAALEMAADVQVRSGFHCAAQVHRWLSTPEGTVRASFGPFNTAEDCQALIETVASLVAVA